jgi:hypothetical protein
MAPLADMFLTLTGACSVPARNTAAKNMLERGWVRASAGRVSELFLTITITPGKRLALFRSSAFRNTSRGEAVVTSKRQVTNLDP